MAKHPKRYPVGIVGEASYQGAISVCREGETVHIYREAGNPYDRDALVVVSSRDEVIGYIAKSSWLREAILDQEKGCEATILSIEGDSEPMAVVIEVSLNDSTMGVRDYVVPKVESQTGCLLALVIMPVLLAGVGGALLA